MAKPAAGNILSVIEYLAAQSSPVPATTIARALGLPRSTVYELLTVATERGYGVHIPEKRRYALGVRAFELASGYQRQQPLVMRGTPLLLRLVSETHLSAHLAVLHGTDVIYLIEERARRGPWLVSDVGVRLPAHLTATGRSILAHLPPAQMRALYPSATLNLVTRTAKGPMTVRELRRILSRARMEGYALESGEVTEGLSSIALPVFDPNGWPIASVALTGDNLQIQQRTDELAGLISRVASILSSSRG